MNIETFFKKSGNTTEVIDVTPDISLMPKLSNTGYSVPQAIAELVDNSVDASSDTEKLLISVKISDSSISVADNGRGMNREAITGAFTLAKSEKVAQLGEFGLGLKTASLRLGDYFEVISTTAGEPYIYKVCFDNDKWLETRDWNLELMSEPADTNNHFTVVNIRKIKIFYPSLQTYIRNDLQKRYAPFIKSGNIEILVNGKACKPEELDTIEDTIKKFDITLNSGKKISGWYGLLKEGSQKGFYGFTSFRRGRMITAYDKIGFNAHPTLARIVGEIHMDHVPVSHDKRGFETETREYKEVIKAMEEELKELVKEARKKSTQESATKDVLNEVDAWKDLICDALRHEDFKNYTYKFKDGEPVRDESGETSEIDVEERAPKLNASSAPEEPKAEKDRKPKDVHKRPRKIRIRGKNINFNHDFMSLGLNESWMNYNYEESKGLEIITNTDFPAFLATKDKSFYAVFHIAEAIASIFAQVAGEDASSVEEIRELILRKSASLKEGLDE